MRNKVQKQCNKTITTKAQYFKTKSKRSFSLSIFSQQEAVNRDLRTASDSETIECFGVSGDTLFASLVIHNFYGSTLHNKSCFGAVFELSITFVSLVNGRQQQEREKPIEKIKSFLNFSYFSTTFLLLIHLLI